MTSILPPSWADEKFGASAETSHLYMPLDLSVNRFSFTRTLFDMLCWKNNKYETIRNIFIVSEDVFCVCVLCLYYRVCYGK